MGKAGSLATERIYLMDNKNLYGNSCPSPELLSNAEYSDAPEFSKLPFCARSEVANCHYIMLFSVSTFMK
jgi:hypothetical protein